MAELKEACGVFGMYDLDGGNVVPSIYLWSYIFAAPWTGVLRTCSFPHRGERGNIQFHKDLGLVSEVLREILSAIWKEILASVMLRYSTTGASVAENAQPLVLNYIKGTLGLAHNGNLINTPQLRQELARQVQSFRRQSILRLSRT